MKEINIPFMTISDNHFTRESDLEKVIIKDLSIIEDGMTLVKNQYWVPGGRIDILARDKNNKLCIIELKIKEDDERIVAQCIYYPTQFYEDVRVITITPSYTSMLETALKKIGVELKVYKYLNNKLMIFKNKNNFMQMKLIKRMGINMKKYYKNNVISMDDLGFLLLLVTFIRFEDNSLMKGDEFLSQKDIIKITGWDRKRTYQRLKKLIDNDIIYSKSQKDDKRKMQYYINPEFFTEYSRSLIDKVNK
jgi:DNA-binding MarR family transcriptional regulator